MVKRIAKKIYDLNTLKNVCDKEQIDFSKILITKKKDDKESNVSEEDICSITYIKGECSTPECRGIFCRYFKEVNKYGGKCVRCIRTIKYNLNSLNNLNLNLKRSYFNDELHAHFFIEGTCLKCSNSFSRKFQRCCKDWYFL
jgi:hypothetical protein